ncbi:hypothetical protein, partial [Klebsiella pneumoniae]|uniref:hypothetical protein n=1 Tax=Klebsiella pneumoniae TaxID=573 RepID=UPI0022EB32B5
QLERDIHRLNGVVGDGDFRQIGLDGGKAQRGGLLQQAAVDQQLIHAGEEALILPSPISSEMSAMRLSLWTGLLGTVVYNQNR